MELKFHCRGLKLISKIYCQFFSSTKDLLQLPKDISVCKSMAVSFAREPLMLVHQQNQPKLAWKSSLEASFWFDIGLSDLFLQRRELTSRNSSSLQVTENRLEESKPTHSVSLSLDIILANVISLSWSHPANKHSIGHCSTDYRLHLFWITKEVSAEEFLCSLNELSYMKTNQDMLLFKPWGVHIVQDSTYFVEHSKQTL